MARIEKTIFISYRRSDVYTALAVYENLKNQGYDVFFDYRSISSGDFEQIITSNIKARAHFLLILTPTALDRCNEPGDWLRREIEIAIQEKRNIVPLFFKGFRFGVPAVSEKLTGTLKNLSRYNGLNVHEDYFDEGMQRLRTQFLNIPLDTILHPVSTEVLKVVREEQVAADKALKQIVDVKELVKQPEDDLAQNVKLPKPIHPLIGKEKQITTKPGQMYLGLAGGFFLIVFCLWGGINFLGDVIGQIPSPTITSLPTSTRPLLTPTIVSRSGTPTQKATSGKTSTPTITSSPTVTKTPTLVSTKSPTPDVAATQFMNDVNGRIQGYFDNGYISSTDGNLRFLYDDTLDLAKMDYVYTYPAGFYEKIENFAVWMHIKWESSVVDSNQAGCGFGFRIGEEYTDGYRILLTKDRVYMMYCDSVTNKCPELGKTRGKGTVKFSYPAQADLELIVNEQHAYVLVNGEFIGEYTLFTNKLREPGYLRYSILSNTNKDYGIRCDLEDGAVWVVSE